MSKSKYYNLIDDIYGESVVKEKYKTNKKDTEDGNYLSNSFLREKLIEYRNTGIIPEQLHQSILTMCNNISHLPCFSGYSYRQDMVMDSYEKVLKILHKISPDKNIFSYITSVVRNKFIEIIKKNKVNAIMISDMYKKHLDDRMIERNDGNYGYIPLE